MVMLKTLDLILINLKRDGYRRIIRSENLRPSQYSIILCPDKYICLRTANEYDTIKKTSLQS